MYKNHKISVSIPAHNESEFIKKTIEDIPDFVDFIIVTDDKSEDDTLTVLREITQHNIKLTIIQSQLNEGKGASVLKAHNKGIELGAKILVAIDSDGQMDCRCMSKLIDSLLDSEAGFSQGNRFANFNTIKTMPISRLIGNIAFSLAAKIFTGYWGIMDPMSGYTAIRSEVFKKLDQNKIEKRFNFEPSLIMQLANTSEKISQISIPTIYGNEVSDIKLIKDGYLVIKGLFLGFLEKKYTALKNAVDNSYNVNIKKFTILTFVLGLLFIFLIPPFQKPDEVVHYYRAASYARGHISCKSASLIITNNEIEFANQMHVEDIKFKYNTKFDVNYLRNYLHQNTTQEILVKNILCSQLTALHIIPAIGIYIGTLIGQNEVISFYLGRIFCLISALAITILAIKEMPFGKRTIVVATLLPMTLNQYTSIGYDAILIPSTFLVISKIMKAYNDGVLEVKDKLGIAFLIMLIVLTKVAYLPLILLPMIFIDKKSAWKKSKILKFVAIMGLSILTGIFYQYFIIGMRSGAIFSDYSPTEQLIYLLQNPLRILFPIVTAWIFNSGFYILSLIGVLGWLDLYLQPITYLSIVLLATLYITENNDVKLSITQLICYILIISLTPVSIFVSMYILSTNYMGNIVMGVQGRYFTPILTLILLLVANTIKNGTNKNFNVLYALGTVSITIQVIVSIVLRYYLI